MWHACLGACIGMQTSMRVFVLACKHLVFALCQSVFKVGVDRRRADSCSCSFYTTSTNAHSELRYRSKVRGYYSLGSLVASLSVTLLRHNERDNTLNRSSVVLYTNFGDVCSHHSCKGGIERGGERRDTLHVMKTLTWTIGTVSSVNVLYPSLLVF